MLGSCILAPLWLATAIPATFALEGTVASLRGPQSKVSLPSVCLCVSRADESSVKRYFDAYVILSNIRVIVERCTFHCDCAVFAVRVVFRGTL